MSRWRQTGPKVKTSFMAACPVQVAVCIGSCAQKCPPHLVQGSTDAILKFLIILNMGSPVSVFHWAP